MFALYNQHIYPPYSVNQAYLLLKIRTLEELDKNDCTKKKNDKVYVFFFNKADNFYVELVVQVIKHSDVACQLPVYLELKIQ